jgi:hypothetical protein
VSDVKSNESTASYPVIFAVNKHFSSFKDIQLR